MKSQKLVNILFLGGAKRVSFTERLIIASKTLSLDIKLYSYELDKNLPIASLAEVIIGQKWQDVDVIDHMLEVIDKYDINILLPFVDPAISIAAKIKLLRSRVFIPLPDENICNTFFNKVTANAWFKNHDFLVPENTKKIPLFAKHIKGSASQGIAYIRTKQELDCFNKTHRKEDYLIQKYIEGEEYSVDCYVSCLNGSPIAIVPRKRLEITSGEVTKTITIRDEEMIVVAKKIILASQCLGPLTIQFIKEKTTNKLYVIEINTRFGGGVIASIQAGADFPAILLKDYLGLPNKYIDNWQENLIMTRAYREFFYANNN